MIIKAYVKIKINRRSSTYPNTYFLNNVVYFKEVDICTGKNLHWQCFYRPCHTSQKYNSVSSQNACITTLQTSWIGHSWEFVSMDIQNEFNLDSNNRSKLDKTKISLGVPKGSHLGPILYYAYLYDSYKCFKHTMSLQNNKLIKFHCDKVIPFIDYLDFYRYIIFLFLFQVGAN